MDEKLVHLVFEALAYVVGARVYLRSSAVAVSRAQGVVLLGGAIFGAFVGSKVLHILEHLPSLMQQEGMAWWMSGKSLLGGLLGGTLGVEIAKRIVRITTPTGDPWVPALVAGIAIGRIGCQLAGTWDLTYGTPTSFPIAWDYGDGIGRHPTAIYEIAGVIFIFLALRATDVRRAKGATFAAFMLAYCVLRFFLEFLKPPFGPAAAGNLPVALYGGLTAIQWAALIGAAYFIALLRRRLRQTAPLMTPGPRHA